MIRVALALLLTSIGLPAGPRVISVEPGALAIGGIADPVASEAEIRITVVGAGSVPPVAGEVIAVGDTLRFLPAFPFSTRAEYLLEFGTLSERFKLEPAGRATPPAKVVAIYPSGDALPQNQLKFYIHFSRPMSRGEAYQHIRLLDSEGEIVADPFLELAEELWDADGERLTVFLDPARVKRGLKPHREAGPPLKKDAGYRLEIAAAWKDAERRPMSQGFRKDFRTVAPDYRQPDPARWQLDTPTAGTRNPLAVTFDGALDHALLERMIQLRREGSDVVLAGEVSITDREACWVFTPAELWQGGEYRLLADSDLEDLAGNSIRKPFEVTEQNPGRAFIGPTVSRSFLIAPESSGR